MSARRTVASLVVSVAAVLVVHATTLAGRTPLHAFAAPSMAALPVTATSVAADTTRVLVVHHTVTGHTAELAAAVAAGARAAGACVVVRSVADVTERDLLAADGIVLGSPTHWANVSAAMQSFITGWPELADRVGGAFATGGAPSGGSQHVVTSLLLGMLNHGMIVVGPLFMDDDGRRLGGFGATAVTGPADPGLSEAELAEARALGARVAEVAARVRAGRREP